MRWERWLRSEPSRGMKKSRKGFCQSREEVRKCRKKSLWVLAATEYIVGTPTVNNGVSSFCSSFYFLELFLLQPLSLMPFPSSLLCHSSFFAWMCLAIHLSQVPWLSKQASERKDWLHMAEVEGVGKNKKTKKQVEKLHYSSKAVHFIQ